MQGTDGSQSLHAREMQNLTWLSCLAVWFTSVFMHGAVVCITILVQKICPRLYRSIVILSGTTCRMRVLGAHILLHHARKGRKCMGPRGACIHGLWFWHCYLGSGMTLHGLQQILSNLEVIKTVDPPPRPPPPPPPPPPPHLMQYYDIL